jgi:osmotically inducible protein OsmC
LEATPAAAGAKSPAQVVTGVPLQRRANSDEGLTGGAFVVWNGDLKRGSGTLRFELGAGHELPLTWPGSTAFGPGATSPEELAAAAHAACFAMTLAYSLTRAGHAPHKITTAAEATFGVVGEARMIRRSRLEVTVDAAGLSEGELGKAAEVAGLHCPVSNTLRAGGVLIETEARLAGRARHLDGD